MHGKINLLAVISILFFSVVFSLFWFMPQTTIPSTKVEKWEALSPRAQEIITKIVEPLEGEQFIYFYSAGVFRLQVDGNLVTDKRLVSYFEENDQLYVSDALYPDIKGITVTNSKSWLEDTFITVNFENEDEDFDLLFSAEANIDRQVIDYINRKLNLARSSL